MIIAIISDIHDHFDYLSWAMNEISQKDVEYILCLGDIVSPFAIKKLSQSPLPVFSIFGNNEGDRARIIRESLREGSSVTMADGEYSEWEKEGKKYFLSHYPDIAEYAACSGKYEAVFHGHTHKKRNEKISHVPIINPGEICGSVTGIVSFALFDTSMKSVEFVEKLKNDF
ncbi:MAG: YfcE family phosphodiesterase [Candidatus Moraniibacteriota bacterium]|nr:MAG: YfcE family phosphodiesterase [Candidatus Moranbacteria bacterium]